MSVLNISLQRWMDVVQFWFIPYVRFQEKIKNIIYEKAFKRRNNRFVNASCLFISGETKIHRYAFGISYKIPKYNLEHACNGNWFSFKYILKQNIILVYIGKFILILLPFVLSWMLLSLRKIACFSLFFTVKNLRLIAENWRFVGWVSFYVY